jgi:putative Mg2+ transporter-C (MgtC) family protein
MIGMTDYMFRIGCAFLMGALIGLERQFRQHNAGLRTNILVSLASAAFTVLSVTMTTDGGDPSRVAAQIVSGIGFLGGGLILKEGFTVRGLNTAATIWCSAACGTLSGVAMYKEGFVLVIFVLLTHCLLRPLCKYIVKCTTKVYHYTIRVECQRSASDLIQSIIMDTLAFNKEVKMNSMFYKGLYIVDGKKMVK